MSNENQHVLGKENSLVGKGQWAPWEFPKGSGVQHSLPAVWRDDRVGGRESV